MTFLEMAQRLPLLQTMAYRWYLGKDQPGHPPTPADSPEKGSSAQRRHRGFPIRKDHRGRRRGTRLRWWQEGQGPQAPHPGGHRGFRTQSPAVHSAKVMDQEGIKTLLRQADTQFPRLRHLWLDGGYRGEDKGKDWVEKVLGWSVDLLERPRKAAPEEVMKEWSWAKEWAKEGVAVDWQKFMPPPGSARFPGVAEAVGGRTHVFLDRPQQEDEQRLREALCERGSVGICCHESSHAEAVDPPVRTFHTVSEGKFCEVRP
jgi:hypothetical protein